MKHIIVANFVIIALSSMIKCEAKALFLFPLRFDFKQDKTNDGAVKTLVYASPFTGKTYNLDYTSNWNPAPITLPPLPPPKAFNFDFNWNFNHGAGAKSVVVNKETTATPSTTTSKSTTVLPKSGSYIGQVGHKKVDVKWDFNFNHGGSATTSSTQTSSTEKPIKDDESERVKEDEASKNETILDGEDNDINPTSKQDH